MSVQGDYLKEIADAIRFITEEQKPIKAKEFAPTIRGIQTGIKPSGVIKITENGTYDVTQYAIAEVNVASAGGQVGGAMFNYDYISEEMAGFELDYIIIVLEWFCEYGYAVTIGNKDGSKIAKLNAKDEFDYIEEKINNAGLGKELIYVKRIEMTPSYMTWQGAGQIINVDEMDFAFPYTCNGKSYTNFDEQDNFVEMLQGDIADNYFTVLDFTLVNANFTASNGNMLKSARTSSASTQLVSARERLEKLKNERANNTI